MDRLLETAEQGLEKNELDNLKKVFDLGFINDEEYKRRRQEILLRADKSPIFDLLPMPPMHFTPEEQNNNNNQNANQQATPTVFGLQDPSGQFAQLSFSDQVNRHIGSQANVRSSVPDLSNVDQLTRNHALSATLVCFFADGTEFFNKMTREAVRSFLESTPRVRVGLLTLDNETKDKVLEGLKEEHKIRVLHSVANSPAPLPGWNATQYKLCITQFLSIDPTIESLFWFDSDLIVFNDMSDFLLQFSLSPSNCQFFFVADHVNFQQSFIQSWEQTHRYRPFIPQACLMGFKTTIARQFFNQWQQTWSEWISPKPFSRYPDPNPTFSDSAFCAEQYALGMTLHNYLITLPADMRLKAMMQFDRTVMSIAGNESAVTVGTVQVVPGQQRPTSIRPFSQLLASAVANRSSSRPTSRNTTTNGTLFGQDDSENIIWFDQFGGSVFHTYSRTWEAVFNWWVRFRQEHQRK